MRTRETGQSLLELLVILILLGTIAGIGLPRFWRIAQDYRLRGAAFYLRGLIRQVRAQAASQSRYVGIVFDDVDGTPCFSIHGDGNANGIRRADIEAGVDLRIRGPWRLSDQFPGVRYGSPPQGSEPALAGLRIGRSDILSFSPLGTSTSGTVFLSNEHGFVYGVIVLGATGRVRVRRFREGRWEAIP